MGSHGGSGFGPSKGPGAEFEAALKSLINEHPLNSGNSFGVKGTSSDIQVLRVEDPQGTALKFWSKLSASGRISRNSNGSWIAKFADGSHVVYRENSTTPNTPMVKISLKQPVAGLKSEQNIHFVAKESAN